MDTSPTPSAPPTDSESGTTDERLHRSRDRGVVAGVCAGLAEFFDLDPTLVRLGFVALGLIGGLAVPLYIAGWVLIPDQGSEQSVAEELLGRGTVN